MSPELLIAARDGLERNKEVIARVTEIRTEIRKSVTEIPNPLAQFRWPFDKIERRQIPFPDFSQSALQQMVCSSTSSHTLTGF
jgi:hypothetical protein